jgi:hypothetical protein
METASFSAVQVTAYQSTLFIPQNTSAFIRTAIRTSNLEEKILK